MKSLQEGIYYTKGSRPGNSIGLVFLRTKKSSKASDIGKIITRIWATCSNLKKGISGDFRNSNLAYPTKYNDLRVLIGYGPKIFDLNGALRKRPRMFSDSPSFEPYTGGGTVFASSDLSYDDETLENHVEFDDIVIQFISNSAFVTNQGIVEIWRELLDIRKDNTYDVSITKFYDGFRRADNRNWMGFHDGVSNIKYEERKDIIAINNSQVKPNDVWTIEGTFMSFIRMYVDLPSWWNVERNEQELMVGRDKLTGCPLIGVNESTKKNIVVKGCPAPGTKEVTDDGNEIYRNHPKYGLQILPAGVTDKPLDYSHIAEARRITRENIRQKEDYQIFRQGYEFLENGGPHRRIRAGLNFISFQDNPVRLFNTLGNIKDINKSNQKKEWNVRKMENQPKFKFNSFFKVGAAGLFFVPPNDTQETFPGAGIFLTIEEMRNESNQWSK